MDIAATFGTDLTLENDGVWQPLGSAKVKVARSGNKPSVDAYTKKMRPHRFMDTVSAEYQALHEKASIEVLADHILLDWADFTESGKPLVYSRDAAIRLLTQYKDFRDQISVLSLNISTFQKQAEDAIEKN